MRAYISFEFVHSFLSHLVLLSFLPFFLFFLYTFSYILIYQWRLFRSVVKVEYKSFCLCFFLYKIIYFLCVRFSFFLKLILTFLSVSNRTEVRNVSYIVSYTSQCSHILKISKILSTYRTLSSAGKINNSNSFFLSFDIFFQKFHRIIFNFFSIIWFYIWLSWPFFQNYSWKHILNTPNKNGKYFVLLIII